MGLTPTELAARHTIGRDLPVFSGNPTEWPAFITAYRESTLACRFSYNENLVRLCKSLQGNALRMVSSMMTKAENVPTILERLKMFFGNSELILEELLARLRSLPVPKSNNFETLIAFAVEVENLGVALEGAD